MSNRPIINHDPQEPPPDRSKSPWLAAGFGLVLGWAWFLYFFDPAWPQIAIGALTAGIFVAYVTDVTGNRAPASWRKHPPRR